MLKDKRFLTYNQQMKKLRDDKKIFCAGTLDKTLLCRTGYFNLVNGYKLPFVAGVDNDNYHIYHKDTSISHLAYLRDFDFELRHLLLKYITKVEDEIRSLAAYSFDVSNKKGKTAWYNISAYDSSSSAQNILKFISKAFNDVSNNKTEYVEYYRDNYQYFPTWILTKVIKFSNFILFIRYSKKSVRDSICKLYSIFDEKGYVDHKLLIGSLYWLKDVRNVCAHNERFYDIHSEGYDRINETYFQLLSKSYNKGDRRKKLIDALVYLKYYLVGADYDCLIQQLQQLIIDLKSQINPTAFSNVRAAMGIKDLSHLEALRLVKKQINYNSFG